MTMRWDENVPPNPWFSELLKMDNDNSCTANLNPTSLLKVWIWLTRPCRAMIHLLVSVCMNLSTTDFVKNYTSAVIDIFAVRSLIKPCTMYLYTLLKENDVSCA